MKTVIDFFCECDVTRVSLFTEKFLIYLFSAALATAPHIWRTWRQVFFFYLCPTPKTDTRTLAVFVHDPWLVSWFTSVHTFLIHGADCLLLTYGTHSQCDRLFLEHGGLH